MSSPLAAQHHHMDDDDEDDDEAMRAMNDYYDEEAFQRSVTTEDKENTNGKEYGSSINSSNVSIESSPMFSTPTTSSNKRKLDDDYEELDHHGAEEDAFSGDDEIITDSVGQAVEECHESKFYPKYKRILLNVASSDLNSNGLDLPVTSVVPNSTIEASSTSSSSFTSTSPSSYSPSSPSSSKKARLDTSTNNNNNNKCKDPIGDEIRKLEERA